MADQEPADVSLELSTIDEIVKELQKRFEGVVVITTNFKGGNTDSIQVQHCGGYILSIGLCEYAKKYILSQTGINLE